MNKESFICKMKEEGWEFEDTTNKQSMVLTSDAANLGPIKYPPNEFKRGNFLVYVEDTSIENCTDEGFDDYFKELTKGYHFYDDWKKAFIGSEFLIPVVEKELKEREYMMISRHYSNLKMVQNGHMSLEEAIGWYDQMCDNMVTEMKLQ